jgi:ubiquinone/menaquinone biosynthesis C-methylase UbiE
MGFQGADWLVRKDREETERPEKVLDALAIAEGSTVADVGAGNGYFTFRIARRVGSSGRVLATDLQEEMLRLLRERIEKDGARNIEPILATETDPHLPADAVDLALMVDVYHELSKPAEVLTALRRSLKAGGEGKNPGRLVLIEYRGEDPLVAIKPLHRTTVQQIRAEIEPRGFKLLDVKGFLPYQHILVFEKS